MQTTIQKWGNSQGIRIPKAFLEAVGMSENDCVELERLDNSIIIKKITQQNQKITLDDIFAEYGQEYQSEFDWGDPVGKQVW